MKVLLILILAWPILSAISQAKSINNDDKINEAIDLGCTFLLHDQNSNGSWGSPTQTKNLNIFAPIPGSHRAFKLAVTALSVSALIEAKGADPIYAEIIIKVKIFFLKNSPNFEEQLRLQFIMSGLILLV